MLQRKLDVGAQANSDTIQINGGMSKAQDKLLKETPYGERFAVKDPELLKPLLTMGITYFLGCRKTVWGRPFLRNLLVSVPIPTTA